MAAKKPNPFAKKPDPKAGKGKGKSGKCPKCGKDLAKCSCGKDDKKKY